MGRTKEEPRGRLATFQDMLTGGSKLIVDQAQTLRDVVGRRIVDVGRVAEEQAVGIVGVLEEQLGQRLDVPCSLAAFCGCAAACQKAFSSAASVKPSIGRPLPCASCPSSRKSR